MGAERGAGGPARTVVLHSPQLGWAGLDLFLQEVEGVRIVAQVAASPGFLPRVLGYEPDLVIATGEPPDVSAAMLAREIRSRSPRTKIVMLGDVPDPELFHLVGRDGIQGYLLWSELSAGDLGALLADVLAGRYVIGPAVWDDLPAVSGRGGQPAGPVPYLTDEERAVARALCRGLGVQEIAAVQNTSPRGVERIISHLKEKLGAENRAVLGMKLADLGLDT